MKEKRQNERKPVHVVTFVRKYKDSGDQSLMQFVSYDLSHGGVRIATDDLDIFSLGEEVEIMVEDFGHCYYEGKARIVRSLRISSSDGKMIESGYGLMFTDTTDDFKDMLDRQLELELQDKE